MSDKEVVNLPALSAMTKYILIPVYDPDAAAGEHARKLTGEQLMAFARAAGKEGANDLVKGATYTPVVTEAGVLSWVNDQGLANPAPVNLQDVIGAAFRDNILINGRFDHPINQKNFSSVVGGSGYCLDCWHYSGNDATTVSWSDGVLSVNNQGTSAAYLRQYMETPLPAGVYTASVKAAAVAGTVSIYFGYEDGTFSTAKAVAEGVTEIVLYADRTVSRVQFQIVAGASVSIEAVKLENGAGQTLASQDEEGNWVLNDPPPNKTLELAKCQRFLVAYPMINTGIYFSAYAVSSTVARMTVPLPTVMRIGAGTSIVADVSAFVLFDGTEYAITGIEFHSGGGNIITLTVTSSGLTAGKTYLLRGKASSVFVIDRNLQQ